MKRLWTDMVFPERSCSMPAHRIRFQDNSPATDGVDASISGNSARDGNSNDQSAGGSGNSSSSKSTTHFTPEELQGILQVAQDDDPFGLVVSSLCPSIFGHEIVKVRRNTKEGVGDVKRNLLA